MAVLRIPGQGLVKLVTDRVAVGRAPGCDIVLDSPRVAQHHATFARTEFGWLVLDESGGEGVRVGGRTVSNHFLKPGEQVELGDLTLTFDPPESQVPSSTPTVPARTPESSTATVPGATPSRTGATEIAGGAGHDRARGTKPWFSPPPLRRASEAGASAVPPPPERPDEDPSLEATPAITGRTLVAPPDGTLDDDALEDRPTEVSGSAPTEAGAARDDAAHLEPELNARPSSKYLLGEEPAAGGGPVVLGASASGAYSLGDARTLPQGAARPSGDGGGGARSSSGFELGRAATHAADSSFELGDVPQRVDPEDSDAWALGGVPRSSASVYSLGTDDTPVPSPRRGGASPSIYSLGDEESGPLAGARPGSRSPSVYSLDAADRSGAPGPAAGSRSPSVYSLDAADRGGASGPAAGSRSPSVYSLDAADRGGAPGPTASAPVRGSSPSVYSMGQDPATGPTRSRPSDYSLGQAAPGRAPGPGGPARGPGAGDSWSWVDADPRAPMRGRAMPARGRGIIAVGFALLVLGAILIGGAFFLGLTGEQALRLLTGGA